MYQPYLRDIINDPKARGECKVYSGNTVIDYKTQGEWKIKLSMTINFMSSKDSDEIRTMHSKSNNIKLIIGNKTSKIIEELFESLLQKY